MRTHDGQHEAESIEWDAKEAAEKRGFGFVPMHANEDEIDEGDEEKAQPPKNRSPEGEDQELDAKDEGDEEADEHQDGAGDSHMVGELGFLVG